MNISRTNLHSDNLSNETQTVLNSNTTDTEAANSDTVSTDDPELRKLNLIKQYANGRSTMTINESTMKSITRAIRLVIIPKVKFLPGGKAFGSFEQPDFSHPNCWANKVFDRIGNLKDASDSKKAEVWMAYRSKIKEQFSLHRSSITLKIKNAFIEGECFMMYSHYVILMLLKLTHSHDQNLTELGKHINQNKELAYPYGSPIFNLMKLLDEDNIHKIRQKNDHELFKLCAEICFPWMVSKLTWKNNHQHVVLSKIITIADEALALLILENNYMEWIQLAKGNEIDRNGERLTKYTHGGINKDGTKKGWSLEGKIRFNTLFDEIQVQRDKRLSKEMEIKIKEMWYNANPGNQTNRDTSNSGENNSNSTAMEEAAYVPRTGFDLEM